MKKADARYLGRFGGRGQTRASHLVHFYVLTGRRDEAETLVAEHRDNPSTVALVYGALGDKTSAFEALERVAAVRPHCVGPWLRNPEFAILRGDARLEALRQRLGLPAE